MNYHLVVLTHGDSETLEPCLESFREQVSPAPLCVSILRDGPGYSYSPRWEPPFLVAQIADERLGFCAATAAAWKHAALSPAPYVFYLEHDFVFLRPVDLRALALVLDADPRLAQMALVRGPVSSAELAAGGLVASRPGEYHRHHAWVDRFRGDPADLQAAHELAVFDWLEHRSYFTTNPSLMRRDFMVAHPLVDDGAAFCEGRYGIGLRDAGFSFGAWGDGTPWVDHVGVRSGHGY